MNDKTIREAENTIKAFLNSLVMPMELKRLMLVEILQETTEASNREIALILEREKEHEQSTK